MDGDLLHEIMFIRWKKEAKVTNLNHAEWKAKRDYLKENGKKTTKKTLRSEWMEENTYRFDTKGSYRYIYVRENGELAIYATNAIDDAKNTGEMVNEGLKSFKAVSEMFMESNGMGIQKAFGEVPAEFKRCVPKQFYYINKGMRKKIIFHVSAIDFCSQYPSNLCGKMPDAHTAVYVPGTLPPSREYPFAFYLKSGHVAEYGMFDTHDWVGSYYQFDLFRSMRVDDGTAFKPNVPEEEDVTVLMKASDFTFDDIMEYYYSKRKTDETAKLVMNSFIGYLHRRSNKDYEKTPFAHIAAIAIARSNEKMRHMAEDVIRSIRVLHICVDGCIYMGTDEQGCHEKALGNCFQEFTDCDFRMIGTNAYVAFRDPFLVKMKHGGYDTYMDGTPITEDSVTSFYDMDNWKKREEIEDEI